MTKREPTWWFVAYSVGIGVVIAVAALIGDAPILAAAALPLFAVFGIATANTPWGTLRSTSHDERERMIGREAALVSYYMLLGAVLLGFLIELARGDDMHPWSLLAAIGGTSYAVSLALLSHRR